MSGRPITTKLTTESERKESSTGILFPTKYRVNGDDSDLVLGSVGVRKRWLFNVYAFGLYYHPEKAEQELKRWNTYDIEELFTNLSFYNALISSKFDKGIRMVLARTVKGADLQTAFEESLRPRVNHYANEYSHGHNKVNRSKMIREGLEAVEQFRSQFLIEKLKKGTEIFFKNTDQTLITLIDGEEQLRIENKSLVSALFDVFLGTNPISVPAKEVPLSFFSLPFLSTPTNL